jgi:cytidine deaminase
VGQNDPMKLFESELRVIEAAEELAATLGEDNNHTVAAAAMDAHGTIYRAVNVYHFTGGPCAELVVIGAAATAGAGPLVVLAAAGDGGRGLIPPCGRCRQAMLDLHPDVMVAVPGNNGPQLKPIRKLLPDTYFFPDADSRRILRFNKRYYDVVADGTKTTTVRYDDPVSVGPALFVFEDDAQHRTLEGVVTEVERHRLDQITAGQARLAPGTPISELRQGLLNHYPDLPDEAELEVVTFTLQRSKA